MPQESNMNVRTALVVLIAIASMATTAMAQTLKKGTPVTLAFDQALTSKTAKAGDRVKLHVVNAVMLGSKTVIAAGTHVTATISEVQKKGRFGKNAQLKLDIDPVMGRGTSIPLQPRQKGNMIGGTRGNQAAGVAGAGALVLGPLGLGAGYFVVGKAVNVHAGQKLETQVSEDVMIH
jgi:hypothetical protein